MHQKNIESWQHDHVFGQNQKKSGEPRTLAVVSITAIMMVVEVVVGILSGSMALLADGLHMASHASALSINLFAYHYARRHADNRRFTFGTGKVNALGGFTGAVLLAGFAAVMAWNSLERLFAPVEIVYNQAIFVAIVGLLVNAACFFILHSDLSGPKPSHDHPHDHNLRSATLHVLADALTSLLAILALFTAKYLNWIWMDPFMGIVGAVLVVRWSFGLLLATTSVLLDHQGPERLTQKIKEHIESHGDCQISDLHLWSVGPAIYSAIISVVTDHPKTPEAYKSLLPTDLELVHVTVEVNKCAQGSSLLLKRQ